MSEKAAPGIDGINLDALELTEGIRDAPTLTRKMSLMLVDFYEHLITCGVSAKTGIGYAPLLSRILHCVAKYEQDYKPVYEKMRLQRLAEQQANPQPAAYIEAAGTAVPIRLDLTDSASNTDNSIFLKSQTIVPQQLDADEKIESDSKSKIGLSKRDRLEQQDSK